MEARLGRHRRDGREEKKIEEVNSLLLVTTSKARVTSSDALVSISLLFLLRRDGR